MEQPKYYQVAEVLRREIAEGVFRDGEKLMTEESLRERFSVSRQTVRQAIALLENDGLVDRQRGSGTYVRHGSRKRQGVIRVSVITTYISSYIFPDIINGIESVLRRNNAIMTLSATYNDPEIERELLNRLTDGQVDGVIAEGVRTAEGILNGDCFMRLAERNIPVLFVNGNYRELPRIPCVRMDDYGGGRQAAAELLRRGYTRPAGVFKTDDIQGQERARGMAEEFWNHGIMIPEELMLLFGTEHRLDLLETREGKAFLDQLASGKADSLVCYNDVFALPIQAALMERGVRIPEDIGIISFDNSRFSELIRPHLTSLSHPKQAFGELAARKILRMIEGFREDSVRLPWDTVEKETLRKPL